MIIKLLLLGSAVTAGAWLLSGRPAGSRLALGRLLGLALTAAGGVAIVFPDLVTRLAHMVGVGRGADLILYVLVVVFGFTTFAMRVRLRDFEDRLNRLTRSLALLDALPVAAPQAATAPPDCDGHPEQFRAPAEHHR